MTINEIFKEHPNKFLLVTPKTRETGTKFVKTWAVLQTTDTISDCERVLGYYLSKGYDEIAPISTFQEEEQQLPPNLVAKYFRVFYGMDRQKWEIDVRMVIFLDN